jgi:hypothetical protein
MLTTRRARLGTVVVLVGLLIGLCVWFGTLGPAPNAGRYPTAENIVHDQQSYQDTRVVVSGTVVETDPVVIEAQYETVVNGQFVSDTTRFTIMGTTESIRSGHELQVFGTLTDAHVVHAANTVAIPPQRFLYMYLISFLAGLWVLGRLVQTWSFDGRTLSIHRRSTPRVEWRSLFTGRGDDADRERETDA